eukprot:2467242-Pleurochrysis_carterae.AAC.1
MQTTHYSLTTHYPLSSRRLVAARSASEYWDNFWTSTNRLARFQAFAYKHALFIIAVGLGKDKGPCFCYFTASASAQRQRRCRGSPGSVVKREKTEKRVGAGIVSARASAAAMFARQPLPVLTSDGRALRHVADGRFFARCNLHQSLKEAAGRPAVLARAQPSGNWLSLVASRCP